MKQFAKDDVLDKKLQWGTLYGGEEDDPQIIFLNDLKYHLKKVLKNVSCDDEFINILRKEFGSLIE